MRRLSGYAWLWVIFIFGASGCMSSRPVRTYRSFTHAWSRHDGRAIHELVSLGLQETSSPAQWARASRDPHRKTVFLPRRGVIELVWKTEVRTTDSTQKWRYTNHGWKLVSPPFPQYLQDTPDHAVNAFIRAMEFGRIDVLSRLLPDELRLSLRPDEIKAMFDKKRPEVAQLLAQLKKAQGQPVLVHGNTAVFPYGENSRLRLIRQDRGWCIAEPE